MPSDRKINNMYLFSITNEIWFFFFIKISNGRYMRKSYPFTLYPLNCVYVRNISFKHGGNNQYATVRMRTVFAYNIETTIDSLGGCNYTECIVNTTRYKRKQYAEKLRRTIVGENNRPWSAGEACGNMLAICWGGLCFSIMRTRIYIYKLSGWTVQDKLAGEIEREMMTQRDSRINLLKKILK